MSEMDIFHVFRLRSGEMHTDLGHRERTVLTGCTTSVSYLFLYVYLGSWCIDGK